MTAATGYQGFVEVFDDFDHTSISTSAAAGVTWLNSSDCGGTAFALNAGVIGGEGTAQGATDNTDNDMAELAHGVLMWYGALDCMLETRVQFSVVTTLAYNVGFNDDALDDSNTLPVELSGTTWTTNATTWFGMVFDVDATNDNIHAMWVDDDADSSTAIATLRMTGAAPVAATYGTYNVNLYRGTSDTAASIGEVRVTPDESNPAANYGKRFTGTIDANSAQTPHIAFENRDAVVHQTDIDYILVRQRRRAD